MLHKVTTRRSSFHRINRADKLATLQECGMAGAHFRAQQDRSNSLEPNATQLESQHTSARTATHTSCLPRPPLSATPPTVPSRKFGCTHDALTQQDGPFAIDVAWALPGCALRRQRGDGVARVGLPCGGLTQGIYQISRDILDIQLIKF